MHHVTNATGLNVNEVWTILNIVFGPVLAMGGAAAIVIAGITRYREKRQADTSEVIITWQNLAAARKARIEELDQLIVALNSTVEHLEFRIEFLWGALEVDQRKRIARELATEEMRHTFNVTEHNV